MSEVPLADSVEKLHLEPGDLVLVRLNDEVDFTYRARAIGESLRPVLDEMKAWLMVVPSNMSIEVISKQYLQEVYRRNFEESLCTSQEQ